MNLAVVSALFLLPWAVAFVVQMRLHKHLDSGAVGLAATFSLGLPALWLAVVGYLEAGSSDKESAVTIAQVADLLAVAVDTQWEAEARVRRLNDPYPLPVSWAPADASLTDPWESLVKLATSGAGWRTPAPTPTWAAGPDDLVGEEGGLVDVLARVPTGRLVVLGEPGAGKTMLMVRLVLDLLARRANGGPVPFLVSIASWNPEKEDLQSWLGAQLLIDHPALAALPPESRTEPTQAAALLSSGLILPILDGLDEIPDQVRGSAISRINDALRPGERVVVTCRSKEYRDAVRPPEGVEVTLRAAAAVQLRPLKADDVRDYLCDDAGGPVTKARWDPVLAVLGTGALAAQALSTPLMVSLARAIYNPRPGDLTGTLRDPAELCSPALADRRAVESLLFDAFIPAAYGHDPVGRWKAQDAERWLVFLACHLELTIGNPFLAWWQLPLAIRGFETYALGIMAVPAVSAGVLAGVLARSAGGVLAGVVLGTIVVLIGIGAVIREPKPVGMRWQPPGRPNFKVGVVAAVALGFIFGVGFGNLGVGTGVLAGVLAGVVGGSGATVLHWARYQTVLAPLDLRVAASPPAALSRDRSAGTAVGATAGVVVGIVFGGLFLPLFGVVGGVALGVLIGATAGVISSFALAAWPSYATARIWLALRHQLPWPLMGFLADARRRGVLRQAGAVYEFRHVELQHRLANKHRSSRSTRSGRHRSTSAGGSPRAGVA